MKHLRQIAAALLIAGGIGLGQPLVQDGAKAVFKGASPSVVIVVSVDGNGKALKFGSGFAVGRHLVATNYHVVKGASKLRIFKPGTHEEIAVSGMKGVDAPRDLALVQIAGELEPLPLSDRKAEVGDTVYAIGNPRGLEASLSSGLISALRDSEDPKMYQITAPISPGSSGGPVLLENGKGVGVATSFLEGGQNLNFAVQIQQLAKLIQASAAKPVRSVASVSGAGTVSAPSSPSSPGATDAIVYVADTGKTFHRDGCRYLRKSKNAIGRAKAIQLGYKACKVCKP